MNRWQTKGSKKKYKTSLGTTDYDIPMFNYKSSFMIMFSLFFTLFFVTFICQSLKINESVPMIVFGGLAGGLSVAYSQFFIVRKVGLCKQFYVVATLVSLLSATILGLVYFAGVLV